MDQEKIDRIFDQYSRQTSMFKQDLARYGLGLAIVYKYTTAMKGQVRCESEIGKGTRFFVELPL
jgi:two-component system phosphate regulon sensor histidine kinase PhoR